MNTIPVMTTDEPKESPHRLTSTHPKGLTGSWTEHSHVEVIIPSLMAPSDEVSLGDNQALRKSQTRKT